MNKLNMIFGLLLSSALAGCGVTSTPTGGPQPQELVCPEAVKANPSCTEPIDPGGDVTVLVPGAQILDDAVVSYDNTTGTLVVVKTFVTNAYAVGNVVIGGASAGTPGGVPPRRITGLSDNGYTWVISTQEAALTDVVEEGSLDFTRTLTVADIAQVEDPSQPYNVVSGQRLMQALAVSCTPDGTSIYAKSFSKELGSDVKLNGCFDLSLDTTLKLKIRRARLDTFEASVKLTEQAKLELEVLSSSASLGHKWNLGTVRFRSIELMIGPVPILITPYIKFEAGVDGSVSGAVRYTVTQKAWYRAGLQYSNGRMSPINERGAEIDLPDPVLGTPTSLKATAKAYVQAKPGISFFTTVIAAHADADVYALIRAYAKVDVDTNRRPLWQLTAGPQFCYGYNVHLEVLLGLIDETWRGERCGNEIRMLARHSSDVGPVLPSSSNSWNNFNLNFNLTQGEIEIRRIDPSGTSVVVGRLTSSGSFDLTPHIDPVDDTSFVIIGVSKRSSGVFGSYGHQLNMTVWADGSVLWPAGQRGCSSCHSREEYKFTVNKDLAILIPN